MTETTDNQASHAVRPDRPQTSEEMDLEIFQRGMDVTSAIVRVNATRDQMTTRIHLSNWRIDELTGSSTGIADPADPADPQYPTMEEVKEVVHRFVQNNPGALTSEIIDGVKIETWLVLKALEALSNEGQVL